MKRITLITALAAILCVQGANGWAQEYPTMLEGNPKWVFLSSPVDGVPTFRTYYLDGDTTINGQIYHKLYYDWKYKNGNFVNDHPVNVAALREYDGKVLAAKAFYQEMFMEFGNYYEAFEERSDEVVVYDWNVLRDGQAVKVFQDGNVTEREILERTTIEMADGSKRMLYKVFNHDPENLKQGQKAYYEIVDQVGCITNVPRQLVHYLWEPKTFLYPTSSSASAGTFMNFIQNNAIVYQAPKEEYVAYDFIKDMVPTRISLLPASPKGEETIYNLQGQKVSVNSVFSAPSMLPKGVYIINGKKIWVK